MPYELSNPKAAFSQDNAVRVEHPNGSVSWFYRDSETREFLLRRDGSEYRGTVDSDDILRIANHPRNGYETVPVEDSPFSE